MNASAHPAAFARESGLVSGEMAFLFEPTPRRLRVLFNGITLADTTDGWLLLGRHLHPPGHPYSVRSGGTSRRLREGREGRA